jgi:hypothetical protein
LLAEAFAQCVVSYKRQKGHGEGKDTQYLRPMRSQSI